MSKNKDLWVPPGHIAAQISTLDFPLIGPVNAVSYLKLNDTYVPTRRDTGMPPTPFPPLSPPPGAPTLGFVMGKQGLGR